MIDRDGRLLTRAYCLGRLRHFGLVAAVLTALTACSTTTPPPETAIHPTVESQDVILTAVEADIEARRFQLAYQRLVGVNAETAATARAQYAMGEVLLGLDRPKDALTEF